MSHNINIYKINGRNKRLLWACDAADGPLKRAMGIMGKKRFKPLLFLFNYKHERSILIHSFFCPVFYAVFLNKRKRIIQIKKFSSPMFFTSKPATYLLESSGDKYLKVGDTLHW